MPPKENSTADSIATEMPKPPDNLKEALNALMSWQNGKMDMDEMTMIMNKLSETERNQVLEYLGLYERTRRLAHEQEATRGFIANVLRIPARTVRLVKGPVTELTSESIAAATMLFRATGRALKDGWRRGGDVMPSAT